MPFDFKSFDAECASMDQGALQREWEHYTRLISGAATSTAVSGLALPLTLGVSSIGIGFAAPAIHNARKKREIIEKHLQRLNVSHKTRKRDVLTSVAISGGVGVLTLGVGSMGANAIANEAVQHSWQHIAENELAVKVGTHLVLDGTAVVGEEIHMQNKKTEEAWEAYMKLVAAGKLPMPAPDTDFKKPPPAFSVSEVELVDVKAQQLYTSNPAASTSPPPPYTERRTSSRALYFPPPPSSGPVKSASTSMTNLAVPPSNGPEHAINSPQPARTSSPQTVSTPSTIGMSLQYSGLPHLLPETSLNGGLKYLETPSAPVFELPTEISVTPTERSYSTAPVQPLQTTQTLNELPDSSNPSVTPSVNVRPENTDSTYATSLGAGNIAPSNYSEDQQQQQHQQQEQPQPSPRPPLPSPSHSFAPATSSFPPRHPSVTLSPSQPAYPQPNTSFQPSSQQPNAPNPYYEQFQPPPPPSYHTFQQDLPQPSLETYSTPSNSSAPLNPPFQSPAPYPTATMPQYNPNTYMQLSTPALTGQQVAISPDFSTTPSASNGNTSGDGGMYFPPPPMSASLSTSTAGGTLQGQGLRRKSLGIFGR